MAMDLKQFFEPTWKKFTVFVALYFVLSFVGFLVFELLFFGNDCLTTAQAILSPFSTMANLLLGDAPDPVDLGYFFTVTIIKTLNMLWGYFVSCAIINFVFKADKKK